MHELSIREMSEALRDRRISSRELTQHFLDRIAHFDARLNSFITVTPERALQQADAADARLAQGADTAPPLLGIPLAEKDIFCTEGVRTSCGSKMLDNFIAPYSATAVRKLHDEAGAVLLGKCNMDEFAMGSSNETSFYGPVKNPWDETRVPGGSSGGSAAAVAASLAPAATATDTGGSIRQPAALTGLTGIKPTYGRVSRYGMIAFASSLDQGGVLAHSAEDAAYVLQAMAGFDPRDSTSVDRPVEDYTATLNAPLKGLRIGLPGEYFTDGLDAKVRVAIDAATEVFRQLGAEVRPVSLPHAALAVPTYYVVAPAEASSNLSRYDGVRYGHRTEGATSLEELYRKSRAEGFGAEVQRRIMVGTYVLSHGYYDAYYRQAQKVRRLIAQDFDAAFQQVDMLLGPTTTDIAFKLGEKTADPVSMYLNDVYTIAANLAGIPAMNLPCGFKTVGDAELPIGLQLMGSAFTEARLLNAAHQYQQATGWHQRRPVNFE
ncbi:MAG: Asp-tRNA(Asn)/Glu-tRNA(Gln) amidotransferase subunit GatA [Nevskiaceae bacterium]|nr:MAG: Asp-tRNA(Asn)/Glu-tRNA(Gln) amidotransferase subunit GatA [Nevskiaceae bacterium]TBR74453.1 MAG: Asp-tRNA(Asn)/Glu-tRNA(Gln) amidotransferase subunit GatA [Nevskiaceae bacterium]